MAAQNPTLLAPVAGTVVALQQIRDEVFASGMMGGGVGILPEDGPQTVTAPSGGVVVKIHPHAVILKPDASWQNGVLIHLGIDTVALAGVGFEMHVHDGDLVQPGQGLITWDPAAIKQAGYDPIVVIVAMQEAAADVKILADPGQRIEQGQLLMARNE